MGRLRAIFFQVFPRPRRRVSLGALLPLLIFLAAFAAVVLTLEIQAILRFTWKPAFCFLLAAPWVWWIHCTGDSGLSGWRAHAALISRFILVGLFTMLLAEPRAVRKSDTLSLVYALDVSNSMGEKVSDKSLEWILNSVATKPPKDEAGLVVFGRDAGVELPPRQSFPFETINSSVGRDGSDMAKGLSLAAAMLPEGNEGRLVLITDGNETEGNLSAVLDELKSRKIPVDVLPVGFDFQHEVWLERLDLPKTIKKGETYDAQVLLSSLKDGRGKLRLAENGQNIFEQEISFKSGKNRFPIPLPQRDPGYYEYVATIEPPKGEDSWSENNIAMGDIFLKGEGKILIVTDTHSDTRDWETLAEALKQSERAVQVKMAYEFPREAQALLPYDLIIIPNAPADAFDQVQMQALHDAVYNQGIGFIMLGSKETFGPGGYHRSIIEQALPVDMDVAQKKVMPKAALGLVLHTCEFAEGNTWAKRIAKEAVRVLGAQDDAGIINYESGVNKWIFPFTPVKEFEGTMLPLINASQPQDMPDFQGILQMMFDALKANDAAMKHCVIISDGDPSPPSPQLLGMFRDEKISISTVAINPHGGQTLDFMQMIADATGGRFHHVEDAEKLPGIFIKEAKTMKRSMLQNKVFAPSVEFPSPILKGIESMPLLHGYVLTTAKPRANVILQVPPGDAEAAAGDMPEPLLAIWRYGVGTTAAWTSDFSPNWARDWLPWEQFRAFTKQLVTEVSRVERQSDITVSTQVSGSQGVITVEDNATKEVFMEMKARVTGPRDQKLDVTLKQIGPRRYQAQFPLWGKGRYQIAVAGEGLSAGTDATKRSEQAVGGFVVPYSPEYLRFKSNPILIKEIAARTGGRLLTDSDTKLFDRERSIRESSKPVFDWFLLALVIMIPLDVAIRRVQLDWDSIAIKLGLRKKQPSTSTMGALLSQKKAWQAPADSAPKKPVIRSTSALPPLSTPASPATSTPSPKPEAKPSPADESESKSTTASLLARKRKRQDGDQ